MNNVRHVALFMHIVPRSHCFISNPIMCQTETIKKMCLRPPSILSAQWQIYWGEIISTFVWDTFRGICAFFQSSILKCTRQNWESTKNMTSDLSCRLDSNPGHCMWYRLTNLPGSPQREAGFGLHNWECACHILQTSLRLLNSGSKVLVVWMWCTLHHALLY